MKLPKRTVCSFLYTSRQHGGLGLTNMEDMLDVNRVNRLVRRLSSPDKKVSDIAWDQLSGVVRKRKGEVALTDADLQEFLNSTPAQGEYRQGDVRSLRSTVRKSIKRLGCQVTVEGMEVKLVRGEKTVCAQEKKAVRQFLNDARDAARLEHLLQATDQGRCFHLVSQHPSSSHWIIEGSLVSLAK